MTTQKPAPKYPEQSPPVQSRDGRVVWLDFFKAMELAAMGRKQK